MKKEYRNIVCCCLVTIILFPFAARSQDTLAALNAVYITKAMYDHRPGTEQGKKNKEDVFAKYFGYYSKDGKTDKLKAYPFLYNLYSEYSFTLNDTPAFDIIDPSKIYGVADSRFRDVVEAYQDADNETKRLAAAIKNLSAARERLLKNKDIDPTDNNDELAEQLKRLKAKADSLSASGNRLAEPESATLNAIESYLDTTAAVDSSKENIKAAFMTLDRAFKELVIKVKGDVIKILKPGIRQSVFNSLMDLKYRPDNQYASKVNELSLTNEYLISQGSGAAGFSMPNQTEMIDAMAIFLAKRVEQESILWFFDELKKRAKLTQEINIVFPSCMALLKNNEEYDMPKMGKAWRYAIAQDFAAMPEHFFDIPFIDSFLTKEKIDVKQLREYVGYGSRMASLIQKKYTVDEIINNLYLNLNGELSDKKVGPAHFVTLLYALKEEFYVVNNKNSKYLLTPAMILNMPDSMFMTMLSIADMKYSQVFSKILGGKNYFTFIPGDISKIKKVVARILQEMQQIDNIVKQAKNQNKEKENIDVGSLSYTTWQFTGDLVLIFEDLLTLTPTCKAIESKQIYHIQSDLETLRAVLDVYSHIDKKDYYGAVRKMFDVAYALIERYPSGGDAKENTDLKKSFARFNAMPKTAYWDRRMLLDTIRTQAELARHVGFENLEASASNKTGNKTPYPLLAISGGTGDKPTDTDVLLVKRSLDFDKTRYFVLKVASFLNDVASATNSKDLSKVIAAYALPPTSYKRKTGTWNSVFLNAFVGPYVGMETLPPGQSSRINAKDKSGYVYGLTAPIGLSFSKTFARFGATSVPDDVDCKFIKHGARKGKFRNMSKSTFSVFVSVVDIGAVVSYRFTNTDSTLPQQFKWEQFVSPGLHLQYSIHGTPVVFSTGVVYTPLVRKLQENAQYNAIRAYFGILFDIPVFTISSREKYKGLGSQPAN